MFIPSQIKTLSGQRFSEGVDARDLVSKSQPDREALMGLRNHGGGRTLLPSNGRRKDGRSLATPKFRNQEAWWKEN